MVLLTKRVPAGWPIQANPSRVFPSALDRDNLDNVLPRIEASQQSLSGARSTGTVRREPCNFSREAFINAAYLPT
jgi:hypothetical protein